MHRQFRRYLAHTAAIRHLATGAEALVQLDPPRCPQALVRHVLIEPMGEPIARRHRPVRPFGYPRRPQPVLPSHQSFAQLFHRHHSVRQTGGHRRGRELHPRHTRHLYYPLRLRTQPGELLLDHLPNTFRHPHVDGLDLRLQHPPALPLHQVSLCDQRLHQGDQKERMALRALMQPAHQGLRETMPQTAGGQIRRHCRCAEPLQRQLGAVPLPL